MKGSPDPLDLVVRRGRKISRPAFTLYFLKLREDVRSRIVISHKIDKRAVVRNKLRRKIREIIRGKVDKNLGLVIICRPQILKLTKPELRRQIIAALSSIHV